MKHRRKIAAVSAIILSIAQILHIIGAATGAALEANNTYIAAEPTADPTAMPSPIPTPAPTPEPTPIPIGEQAANIAMQYLGTPYVWGGTTPDGFDCSGLVKYVYSRLGICVSRTAAAQSKDGRAITRDELRAGDLVFFANSVKITPLSARRDYYCARRIAE